MKNYSVSLHHLSALVLLGGVWLATPAGAQDTAHLIAPAYRGLAGTEWAGWDIFTTPYGAPGNAQHLANASNVGFGGIGSGVLTQTGTPAALLAGGGNIYSFSDPTAFSLTDATSYTLGLVTFQVSTLGSLLDYDSILLRYDNGNGWQSLATPRVELYNAELGGFGGSGVTSLWQWDVSALGINHYEIVFNAAEASMSLAAATLDTASITTVPEPATGGLLVGAATLMLMGRMRRKHD